MADFLFDEGKNKIEGLKKTEINQALESKADAQAVANAFQSVNEALEGKASTQALNEAVQDINTALNGKADEEEIEKINNEIYGNYTPDYLNGSITVYNDKAVHNDDNNWVYVVIDVSNFIGEKLTISTYADRSRKIIFADNSENVIDTVAIDTGNPNLYSTVEANVPQGATKCYINKYKSGSNDIVIVGYYVPKLALKSEVPPIVNDFGDSENAGVSQKLFTDNVKSSIEKIAPINNKIPIVSEDLPIYLDNLFRGVSPKTLRLIDVNNVYVHIYEKIVATLPVASNGGASCRIRLYLIDDSNYQKYADLAMSRPTVKEAQKKVLFIGDSITENLSYLTPLKSLSDNGNYKITFLGTLGTTIKNEGRGGWAAYNYTHDSSYSGKTNAFWDGEKFNFAWYLSQNNIEVPDYVFINLGTNDLIRGITNPNDDEEVKQVVISSYETMINSIHAYNANIPIVLWLPPTRCMVGRNTHLAIDNSLRINKFLIEKYDKTSYINAKVYLMSTYLFVDPYNDYNISEITINGVTYKDCGEPIHPTSAGGEKIANGILRQMFYIDELLT